MIQQMVNEANKILSGEEIKTKRLIAIGIEINQRYYEYLDGLLEEDLAVKDNGVTIVVEGKKVHFQNVDSFSEWLAENMK